MGGKIFETPVKGSVAPKTGEPHFGPTRVLKGIFMLRRAIIHHRDGNPLNNLDSNYQVVCTKCHRATWVKRSNAGEGEPYYVQISFSRFERQRILEKAHYRCEICGEQVVDKITCHWCGKAVTPPPPSKPQTYGPRGCIRWPGDQLMCLECYKKSPKMGQVVLYDGGDANA